MPNQYLILCLYLSNVLTERFILYARSGV